MTTTNADDDFKDDINSDDDDDDNDEDDDDQVHDRGSKSAMVQKNSNANANVQDDDADHDDRERRMRSNDNNDDSSSVHSDDGDDDGSLSSRYDSHDGSDSEEGSSSSTDSYDDSFSSDDGSSSSSSSYDDDDASSSSSSSSSSSRLSNSSDSDKSHMSVSSSSTGSNRRSAQSESSSNSSNRQKSTLQSNINNVMVAPPTTTSSDNSTNNSIFHQGVIRNPIMSSHHQDLPNDRAISATTTLIHRRGKIAKEDNNNHNNWDTTRNLPQCRPLEVNSNGANANENDTMRSTTAELPPRSSRNGSSSRHRSSRGSSSKSNSSSKRYQTKRKKKSESSSGSNWHIIEYLCCCRVKKRSTQILALAFALWIFAQCYYFYYLRAGGKDFLFQNGHDIFGGDEGRPMSGREKKRAEAERRHSGAHQYDHRDMYQKRSPLEMEKLRYQRAKEARKALGTGAAEESDSFDPARYERDRGGKPDRVNVRKQRGGTSDYKKKNKKSRDVEGNTRTERIRPGCSALEWHSYHFPNCNEIHEIDLGRTVQFRRPMSAREEEEEKASVEKNDSEELSTRHNRHHYRDVFPWGFVGAGLWRDVFTCDPRMETVVGDASSLSSSPPPHPPAVLKMMKSEHPYDQRNFQRHRRDALVMERLSSSHHLVPIYGYCANTVLTKAVSHTLDDVIYAREHERVKKWSPHGGFKTKPALESWMGRDDEDGELLATRESEVGRIRLALGVFRGLVDLHEGDAVSRRNGTMEWLPVVHADLQSKQYLVDAGTGQIYLNDFNRCRFVTKKDPVDNGTSATDNHEIGNNNNGSATNAALEQCPLYIPTAPGASRSPEEYHLAPLSEKLDVYSAGNILYGIITGLRPWNSERGNHIKTAIKKGERPKVDDAIRNAKGTVDWELTRMLDRVYEKDPQKRASAREVVGELERLLERELEKKDVVRH